MKFFIDTANVKEIREAASLGVVDGVTTNPSLIAKEGAGLLVSQSSQGDGGTFFVSSASRFFFRSVKMTRIASAVTIVRIRFSSA